MMIYKIKWLSSWDLLKQKNVKIVQENLEQI